MIIGVYQQLNTKQITVTFPLVPILSQYEPLEKQIDGAHLLNIPLPSCHPCGIHGGHTLSMVYYLSSLFSGSGGSK